MNKLQEEKNEIAGSPDTQLADDKKKIDSDVEAEVNRRLKLLTQQKVQSEFERKVKEQLAQKLKTNLADIAELDSEIASESDTDDVEFEEEPNADDLEDALAL